MITQSHERDEHSIEPDADGYKFRCAFCSETYPNEILTRVHVTRSQDKEHLNYDGFMPETDIELIDSAGNTVEHLSRRPNDLDVEALAMDDIPDEFSEQHKHIILIGAYNQYVSTFQKLKGLADDRLEEAGIDTLSYSTVRRIIREFYRPQEVEAEKQNKSKDNDEERLCDLTERQQAIVIAHLANPRESTTQIARRAGNTAKSYPGQVYKRAKGIIDRLQDNIDDGVNVVDAILSEMTAEDVSNLYAESERLLKDEDDHADSEGFNLGVDLAGALGVPEENVEAFDLPVGEQRKVMTASPYGDVSDFIDQVPGRVDEQDDGEHETKPPDTNSDTESGHEGETEDDEMGEQVESRTRDGTMTASAAELEPEYDDDHEKSSGTEVTEDAGGAGKRDAIPREKIEVLEQEIGFMRRTLERSADDNDLKALAVTEQVEEEVKELLAAEQNQ
jgi:hypothetical protein